VSPDARSSARERDAREREADFGSEAREQWLVAGQALLRRGGIGAVKLQALTEKLGLTSGSFYHHFDGMPAYLDELATYYGSEQPRTNLEALASLPPRDRLRRLGEISVAGRMPSVDAAMRDWATSNERAAAAVRELDDILLRFIADAFAELGYDQRQARARAILMLSTGTARITPPWTLHPKVSEDILDVLAPE